MVGLEYVVVSDSLDEGLLIILVTAKTAPTNAQTVITRPIIVIIVSFFEFLAINVLYNKKAVSYETAFKILINCLIT